MATELGTPRRRGDVGLTEEGIYRAALRLIDTAGVEALSMRKLAGELGVNPMSLYHHVPNKAALLRGVTDLVVGQFREHAETGTWQEQLRQFAHDFRALAHRHRHWILYALTSPTFIQADHPLWAVLCRILRCARVPTANIPRVGAILASLVSGFLQAEASGSLARISGLPVGDAGDGAPVPPVADPDESFDLAVRIVIAGIEADIAGK